MMLDKEPHTYRKPAKQDKSVQVKRVEQFSNKFAPFDWTTQLN